MQYHLPIYLMSFFLMLISCQESSTSCNKGTEVQNSLETGIEIEPVNNTFNHYEPALPANAHVDVLFSEKIDSVRRKDGQYFPAKGKHDFIAYVPIDASSEHGYLFVNHESKTADPNLGDGGGMTWFEVEYKDGRWAVAEDFHHIDFSNVGGTWHNCGGSVTPHGTILTAEEYPALSNTELYNDGNYFTDTSDFNGIKRNENTGWMVEVDIETKEVLGKLFSMGRYSHEDVHCMPDGKTVYLTDDYSPAVFFKFVSNEAGNYTSGQLSAYQQNEDGTSGQWLALPMDTTSLINAREEAIKLGATLFIRQEWIQEANGLIYITETGSDHFDWSEAISLGGKPASYLRSADRQIDDYTYDDPYGRLLAFDPSTNAMNVVLEGGDLSDGGNFSSPDGLTAATINGKEYLVICEDIISRSRNRVSTPAEEAGETYNEVYLLDVSIEEPTGDDLIRLSVGPRGCEQTGPEFTPDGNTMFISIQNPSSKNPEPYNRTSVVAVTGIF